MLRPEEVEMLVCGTNNLDFQELRKVTEYDGYAPDELYIEWVKKNVDQEGLWLLSPL